MGREIVEPARAGNKIGYGAHLLLFQVVVALHGRLLGVVEGHVETLMLPMVHPRDQHFLKTDHFGVLARRPLVEAPPAPALKAVVILSLSFLIVHNVLSGRLSALRMAAVDSPPLPSS